MNTIHPQYITDSDGHKISVVIPIAEYEQLLEELEDMEDIRLYDNAKKIDTGERIIMHEAFIQIESKRHTSER